MPSKEDSWLDCTIDLYSEKIDSVLKSYIDKDKELSILTPIEIDKVSCLLTSKLLNTPDCVNNVHRVLKYREIFEVLTIQVFDLLKLDEDVRILECYRITDYFYKCETSKCF